MNALYIRTSSKEKLSIYLYKDDSIRGKFILDQVFICLSVQFKRKDSHFSV